MNITIRGFIPIDARDLKAHRAALDAVMAAEGGNLGALEELIRVEDFKAEPVTRRVKGDDADQPTLDV